MLRVTLAPAGSEDSPTCRLFFSRIADRQVESHSIQIRIYIAFSIRVSHLLDMVFICISIYSIVQRVGSVVVLLAVGSQLGAKLASKDRGQASKAAV